MSAILSRQRSPAADRWAPVHSHLFNLRDEVALVTMWLTAGVLVTLSDHVGRTFDVVASSPILNFLVFSVWALIALLMGAARSSDRPAGKSQFVLTHLFAALAILSLSLYLYRSMAALRPTRFPLILGRDALVGITAYAAISVSIAVIGLTRKIGRSTQREAELAAAIAVAEVRDAGSTTEQLRELLAEIRERLGESADRAERFATATADLLRARLEAGMASRWTLGNEIRLLDREIDLDRERSGVRTRVAIDAPAPLLEVVTPARSVVGLWRQTLAPSPVEDREVLLVARETDGGLLLSIQTEGSAADQLIPSPRSPVDADSIALARFGRWVARHQGLSVAIVAFAAVLIGTSVIAMHRAAMIKVEPAWLIFMLLRASCWMSSAVLLTRLSSLGTLRSPFRLAVIAVAAALAGEIVFAVFMHWFIFPPAAAAARARRALGMAMTSICHPTFMTLAVVNVATAVRSVGDLVQRTDRLSASNARFRAAQLRALRWQVNPHLLFNALNSAAALIRSDPATAETFLKQMESFYARLARNRDREFVPLGEELDLVREYLRIEAVRFPRLRATYSVDHGLESEQVPSLLLQPLIENAVKFGSPVPDIDLRAERREDGWAIRVSSHIDDRPRQGAGVGLAILEERLRGHYGDFAVLDSRREGNTNVATITVREEKAR